MIEYKRISFKYVVLAFLIAAFLIILLSVDRKNNEAPPIEDVFIEAVSYTHLTLPTKAHV